MITVEKTEIHNRTLLFKGLRVDHHSNPSELLVHIRYDDPQNNPCGNGTLAVPLDNQVIPAIHNAFECRRLLKQLESRVHHGQSDLWHAVEKALKGAQ